MMLKYIYHFKDDILIINDQGGAHSVTNQMEKILAIIHMNEAKDLTGTKIIYSDSVGLYDGVIAKNLGSISRPSYEIDFIVWSTEHQDVAITEINQFYKLSQ